MNLKVFTLTIAMIGLLTSSCSNSFKGFSLSGDRVLTTTGSGTSTATSGFKISNVVIQGSSTNIYFDAQQTTDSLSNYCSSQTSDGSLLCQCEFSWSELNSTTGSTVTLSRSARSSISQPIQKYLVTCDLPAVYDSEIPDGAIVRIRVVGASGDNSALNMTPYQYTKAGASSDVADFRDAEGRGFVNIHRYSCFEESKKGLSVVNRTEPVSGTAGGNPATGTVVHSTELCVAKANGDTSSTSGCSNSSATGSSAQSYYYNLFVPSADRGGISKQNNRYTCPFVKEPLDGGTSVGQQGVPWPMDTTFALARKYSPEFSVGVRAPSVLSISGDPSTAENTCQDQGSVAPGTSGASISNRCVGYAMKPDSNGACPYFKDANGGFRLTHRLRRYVAKYPVTFEADGYPIEQAQGVDVVYVLDRPVKSGDPLRPYTMLGPKPCNFSYFDKHAVTQSGRSTTASYGYGASTDAGFNATPGYRSTNSQEWYAGKTDGLGVNPDNIHFPNFDSRDRNSCSVTLPIIEYTAQGDPLRMTLGTTHHLANAGAVPVGGGRYIYMDKVYVRPMRPWAPHYEEDLSFQACAPQADPYQDPPLHFAKDSSGNISWCAMAYPTQNDAVALLDQRKNQAASDDPLGFVRPYTSPVVKNSVSSACTATVPALPTNYPTEAGAGAQACATTADDRAAARHGSSAENYVDSADAGTPICGQNTCDRTVVNPGGGWKYFPLQAKPQDIETMLRANPSYNCTLTWDDNRGKAGKSTPSTGCCAAGILRHDGTVSLRTSAGPGGVYDAAHLQPDRACLTPDY